VDAEHYELLARLKAHKSQYRLLFDSFKELRVSLDSATYAAAQARQALVSEFERWAVEQGSPQVKYMQAGELLDPTEAFERLQVERIMATDPNSTAYHAARKRSPSPGHRKAAAMART